MKLVQLFALVLMPAALAACGKKSLETPPAVATGGTQAPTAKAVAEPPAAPTEDAGKDPRKSQINISDEIRKACGIADTDAFFAFDSANVREQDRKVLTQLADCFSKGALKGREMRLVGHADPRGESEYNMVLGEKRATSVKGFIAKQGLADGRMSTTSRGAMDATGTSEESWARDRRVDIVLGD